MCKHILACGQILCVSRCYGELLDHRKFVGPIDSHLLVPVNLERVSSILINDELFDHVVPFESEAAEDLRVIEVVDLTGGHDMDSAISK